MRGIGATGSSHMHALVPLKELPGYAGSRQQRFIVCGLHCSWACAYFFALHPNVTGKGSNQQRYTCMAVLAPTSTKPQPRTFRETPGTWQSGGSLKLARTAVGSA